MSVARTPDHGPTDRRTAMGLRTYRQKRDFARTPEPRGGDRARAAGTSFVIQKHAARRLHHDLRLELDGVLLSWAVPKGPPRRTGQKALAMRTEDHPLEYGGFEGVIPAGEYGGGTVMLWDRGTWHCDGDPHRGLAQGKLDFRLEGQRLRGRWSLVRMRQKPGEKGEAWLLIKRSDRASRGAAERDGEPREGDERSVASGRTMAEIAAAGDRTWTAAGEVTAARAAQDAGADADVDVAAAAAALPGARRAAQPTKLAPQLATLVDAAPAGDGWLHEIKYDGYRLLAFVAAPSSRTPRVRLRTRTGQDWTGRYPAIAAALAELPVERAILDGEVVVLRPDGVSDFQALQRAGSGKGAAAPVLVAFDLPHCAGLDLTRVPLRERKRLLATLLAAARGAKARGVLRFGDHVEGNGPAFLAEACRRGLEGIVSKRAQGRYEQQRSRGWLKTKCLRRQEFVVVGATQPQGARAHFGALLLGVHDDGGLRYVGKVGTGFDDRTLADLAARLEPLRRPTSPLVDPPRGAEGRRARWVEPRLVVEVAFTEWTGDGHLRHPSFQGVREDKPAASVRRERTARLADAAPTTPATSDRAASRDSGEDRVAGVRISHPGRVLFAEQGITKLDLARYYEAVAEHLLPHVVDRPLSVVRCPQGLPQKCFYQKHVTASLPAPVHPIDVREKNGVAHHIGVRDVAGLVTLVQFGAIEFHPWGSRADRLDRPDRIVLDLDPAPDVPWPRVVAAAHRLREILAALELQSFARTTGGKGLHVVLPIERRTSWSDAKQFAHDVAALLARDDPGGFVLTMTKEKRHGRIFVDYFRNDQGSTAIASWSARAREGAPVAMPVAWDDLTPTLDPQAFTVRTVPERLRRHGDPWRGFDAVRQRLGAAVRKAVRLS